MIIIITDPGGGGVTCHMTDYAPVSSVKECAFQKYGIVKKFLEKGVFFHFSLHFRGTE